MRKRKYKPETIIHIVKANLESGIAIYRLSEQYGIHRGRIQEWIEQYKINGESAFFYEEHNRVYCEETKRQAIKEYLAGKGSQREIAAKYGLRNRTQLRDWIKVYNSGRGFQRKMTGGSRMKETRSTTVEERIQIVKDCIANSR